MGFKGVKPVCTFLLFSLVAFNQSLPSGIQNKIDALNNNDKINYLGTLCWNLREKSTDTSIFYGVKAIHLADSLGFYNEVAKISNYVGVVYLHYLFNSKKAIPYFHDALEWGLKTKDTAQIAYAYNNLGDAFYLIGNISLAIEYGENSLHYFNQINDKTGIAYSYINLGIAYRADKKYDLALHYFYEAIETRKLLGHKIGVASATLEIAQTYYEKQDYDTALKYFQESLFLHKNIDNKMYMALSLNGIGDILYLKEDYKNALKKYEESYVLNKQGNHLSGIVHNNLGKALIYSKLKRRKAGERELKSALDISHKLGLSSNLLETYKTYAEFYENVDEYKLAADSYKNYLEIYDSLFTVQQLETLLEMQNRFLLSQNLNKIKQDLQTKKKETLYLLIIILLFVILALTLLHRYLISIKLSKQLKLINDSKDKLFTIISHDLKAPFNSILGFSNLLVKEIKNKNLSKIKKYNNYINTLSTDSVTLITNLSNWSRSQRGILNLNKEKFNLVEVINEIYSLYIVLAKNKNIQVTINVDKELMINADKEITRTVISNLLTNAIKFTPQNGNIEISAIHNKSTIEIIVKDSGIGINKEDLNKLFKIKENFTTVGTNNEKGTGLGLIICKEFIDLHHGKISVESLIGKGSSFSIKLPGS